MIRSQPAVRNQRNKVPSATLPHPGSPSSAKEWGEANPLAQI